MTEEQERLNPFPTKLIKDRLEKLDRPIVEKLLIFVNTDFEGGKTGLDKIDNKAVLQDLLCFNKNGLTATLRKFAETI